MWIKSPEQCLIQQERADPALPGPLASAGADQPSPGHRQGREPGGGSSQPSGKEALRLRGGGGDSWSPRADWGLEQEWLGPGYICPLPSPGTWQLHREAKQLSLEVGAGYISWFASPDMWPRQVLPTL